MNLNIENLVRSAAIVAVGLPLSLAFSGLTNATAEVAKLALKKNAATETIENLQGSLTRPCLNYFVSKVDSKLERTAKNEIDEIMGGEVEYKVLCDYIVD